MEMLIPPPAPLLSAAWLSIVFAASYQYFFVRRMLDESEARNRAYIEQQVGRQMAGSVT